MSTTLQLAIFIGIITFINLWMLKVKFERGQTASLAIDVGAVLTLNWLFGGTMSGMAIAMVASLGVTIALFINPPDVNKMLRSIGW